MIRTPQESHVLISTELDFSVINNEAEYEVCVIGMQGARALDIKALNVYEDLRLIINQATTK